nr:hypothetical protein [Lachnospiraceae bacterium]
TKAGNPVVSMVSCLNQNVTVTQKEICVRQPLKFFKLSSSCKTTTAPKSGKIKRVTFGIGQNPAGKKFTGVVTWNVTGGEWLTIDTDRSTGNRGVFIISDTAMSGESAYVTAVITDSVTGESYSDTAMVCIK